MIARAVVGEWTGGFSLQDLLRENAGIMLRAVSSFEEKPRQRIMEHYREETGAVFGDTEEGASLWVFARMIVGDATGPAGEDLGFRTLERIHTGTEEEWREMVAEAQAHWSVPVGAPFIGGAS